MQTKMQRVLALAFGVLVTAAVTSAACTAGVSEDTNQCGMLNVEEMEAVIEEADGEVCLAGDDYSTDCAARKYVFVQLAQGLHATDTRSG